MSYCLNFRIGGAWGLRFFESDHDQDIVAHLSADMGVCKYNSAPQMQDSLLNPHHRAFIVENVIPNELDRVFTKYLNILRDYKIVDVETTRKEGVLIDSPRYYMFVLGLLALQLGCRLSRKYRRWMKDNVCGCLLNDERLEQTSTAVNFEGPGVLKLESQTLNDRIVSLAEETRNLDLDRDIKVPALDIEHAIMRMHLDNEIARSKGATATKGVDISEPLASYPDISVLERAATENTQGMSIPQAKIDMNPEQGFTHWILFQESKGQTTEDERMLHGWTRKQSRDDEMRDVFRRLVQSGLLASYDRPTQY